jgi:hypothetical protein
MSASEKGFILYYYTPHDPDPGGVAFEYKANDLVDALSTAWINQRAGGQSASIAYKDQIIFSGKELQRVLGLISSKGAHPDIPPKEIIWQLLPEVLSEQLVNAGRYAIECLGEAAVYRELLETCYKAATKASASGNVGDLHTGMTLHSFGVPDQEQARTWGKDFVHAYARDAGWLRTAKKALEKIEAEAEKLPDSDPEIAKLKASILAAAKDGLIVHI